MAGRRRSSNGLGVRDYERIANASLNAFQKLDRRAQVFVVVLLLVGCAIGGLLYLRAQNAERERQAKLSVPVSADAAANALLGNPSGATSDPGDRSNYLMVKPYFTLAYNDTTGTPNWVSWRLTRWDLGEAPRRPEFEADRELPPGFYRVTHKDYSGGGFDRGHMCPHGDRAANPDMSFATFVMTNIIPQAAKVNQNAWAHFEDYCRDLVRNDDKRLYITAGPTGRGGVGLNGPADTIARGKVTVPAACWKIVVVLDETGGGTGESADADLRRVDGNTRVIAIVMPNDQNGVGEDWTPYRTSVAEVERRTGYHFFDKLPPNLRDALWQKVDAVSVAPPRPYHRGDRE
jgi:endonuclease G